MNAYFKQSKVLVVLCIFGTLLLSSCNLSSPLELVYFQRVKFSFIDDDKENKIIYLCTKEKTEEETREKAEEANKLYKVEFDKIIEIFADKFSKQLEESLENKDEDFSLIDSISMSWDLQKQTEALVIRIESKYKCLLIDMIEIE